MARSSVRFCMVATALVAQATESWSLESRFPSLAFSTSRPGLIGISPGVTSLSVRTVHGFSSSTGAAKPRHAGHGIASLRANMRHRPRNELPSKRSRGLTLLMSDGLAEMLGNDMLKRVVIWVVFAAFLHLCKPFYGVIIGTFVMSFVGNSVVNTLERQAQALRSWTNEKHGLNLPAISREVIAVFYIIVVLNVLISFTVFTVPQVVESWRFLKQIMLSDNPYVELANSICSFIGPDVTERLEVLLSTLFGEAKNAVKGVSAPYLTFTLQNSLKGYVLAALPLFNKLLKSGTEAFYQLMVSLLFSSICIYDKTAVTKGVQLLVVSRSGVAMTWHVAGSFFGRLVGKSLEAQLLIALWNTFLTTTGLFLLRIPAAAALSILVFFCSFIPLAGVIISTLPMAIVALSEYGLLKLFQVFLMVFVVHAIEAYFLNPKIYSSKLQLHPLLVLIALYVTEKLVGVTALFLAVPVTVFIIKVILSDTEATPTIQPPDA